MIPLDLFTETQRIGLQLKNVTEIGVYFSKNCVLNSFIEAGVQTTLIEADPLCVQELTAAFSKYKNVHIEPRAIWDSAKKLSFYRVRASTFAAEVEGSPAQINDSYQASDSDRFEVDAVPFSEVDPGTFDLVLIDVEGAEWNVLKTMKSRPQVISLEMRAGLYENPNTKNINLWLKENQYKLWFHNDVDSIYIRTNVHLNFDARARYLLISLKTDFQQKFAHFRKKIRQRLKDKK